MCHMINSNTLCFTCLNFVLHLREEHGRLIIDNTQLGFIKGNGQSSCVDFGGNRIQQQIQRALVEGYKLRSTRKVSKKSPFGLKGETTHLIVNFKILWYTFASSGVPAEQIIILENLADYITNR